ncbi:hypothetical protein [Streptomyces nymphaeiformis]|uniref:Uncharacterized protein n=1 Tax=Streptomyces nymphaeiformis TaxID=2663842 RepID=A0A7W7TZJ6_9ACTN|nr:hypothetical protein [Streptomyces nymphaeiformis]MBB4982284.1 hypothetical protein [Streptomyces nymphaeiformis]
MEALAGYWQPPSAIERGPYEARLRGNWPVYYDSVADLHPPQPRHTADQPDVTIFSPYRDPRTRSACLAVHTAGMLPAPVPDPVFVIRDLGWFERVREPGDPAYLVVNPGSPCEGVLPATPEGRALWRYHFEKSDRPVGLAHGVVRIPWPGTSREPSPRTTGGRPRRAWFVCVRRRPPSHG